MTVDEVADVRDHDDHDDRDDRDEGTAAGDDAVRESDAPVADDAPWLRLSPRVIWVDLARTVLSLSPTALAVWVFGVDASWGTLWPLLAVGAWGVLGAVQDLLRWVFTRYRVTDGYVERRTGVLVRRYRSVRRDRIRSVDTTARLRHRVAGLRVVLVGAGQQLAAGESALSLDAVTRADAEALRRELLRSPVAAPRTRAVAAGDDPSRVTGVADDRDHDRDGEGDDTEVLARFRPWWVVYNVFSVWAFVTAAGLLWGAYWLGATFGLDLLGWVEGVADWDALGLPATIAVWLLLTGAIGAVGMGVSFFTTSWGFELARVRGGESTQLRTRHGLFTTREVNRDERRLRGVQIGEPVLWRWMGMADTQVITTGLSVWSASQPATILPRGPVSVARPVASAVLGADPDPLTVPLARHPAGALRRRLWWATASSGVVAAVLWWLAANGALPVAAAGWAAGLWVLALGGAVVAYRALGHAIVGDHLVVRSGLMSRATTVLRRDAVSTIALRESVLQRRLGLKTVSAMTAAGWGIYQAPDVAADEALAFAVEAAPGLLDPFLVPDAPEVPVGRARPGLMDERRGAASEETPGGFPGGGGFAGPPSA
ncbi:PH domain-containing protein [Cellulosimicrobium protaetiae]|uniref:PH domain-containing protein n=1 Tax=Cellulosimicrobium protaetiae TaxID=2587808 RepID=A0A6M5UIX6_9MICO|nr:PH domain-containing protein [Cellulosimicrobium protaetiae]QJW38004.1 PH domain-containing protein [Cellulosimicrobium protaetiae]